MPARLTARQARALIAALARGLGWGLPAVGREVAAWRAHARQITDHEIRAHALCTLERKRGHAAGAALFAILPKRRERNLLRLLVAYETLWDYLDTTNERAPEQRNGRQLHLALIDAIDPSRPCSDCFRHHPWHDGGHLDALVSCSRACCMALPSHPQARQALVLEATRAQVLALNHELHPERRDEALREWSAAEAPAVPATCVAGDLIVEASFKVAGAASTEPATCVAGDFEHHPIQATDRPAASTEPATCVAGDLLQRVGARDHDLQLQRSRRLASPVTRHLASFCRSAALALQRSRRFASPVTGSETGADIASLMLQRSRRLASPVTRACSGRSRCALGFNGAGDLRRR